jgi:HrpA-like RNA helicase
MNIEKKNNNNNFHISSLWLQDRRQLPIAQHEEEIVQAVRNNQVTIIAGDTGCGVRIPAHSMTW